VGVGRCMKGGVGRVPSNDQDLYMEVYPSLTV